MTNEQILAQLSDILVDQLGLDAEDITMEADFIEDLHADSLDLVEMVMNLEEEFDIVIPDEDAEKMRTVGDVVNYVRENSDSFDQ